MEIINRGFAIGDYFEKCRHERERLIKEVTRLSKEQHEEYNSLLEYLIEVNEDRDKYGTKQIGDALENIVSFLLNKSAVFEVLKNVRTSTNEIDQIITLNSDGKMLKNWGALPFKCNDFICECKNYDKKVGVTWVGKFYSLLLCCSCNFGIIFSYKGLSGNDWSASKGLVKKIFLMKEDINKKVYIIDFNIKHFQEIKEGSNLIDIIKNAMLNIKYDTDISSYITSHPAEGSL